VPTTAPEINFNLTEVYIAWMSVIALLYPICRWFADLKQTDSGWWWAYV
jgi:hypothetical protein